MYPSTDLGLHSSADSNAQGVELQKFRRIRTEQDLTYEESLTTDSEREDDARRKALKKQEFANLRNGLKPKFETVESLQNSFVLGLRLPAFSDDNLTKTLYEFAFCAGEINGDFSIETLVPRRIIPCSFAETLVQCGIDHSCLLTVSYTDDDYILESLMHIKLEGEIAIDSGGVRGDMLSAYWEDA